MESNQMEMETDQPGEGSKNVKNVCSSGIEVSLHPMVILNISECHTRLMVQNPNHKLPLIGAIIGTHQGRRVEILNSFELPLIDTKAEKMEEEVMDDNDKEAASTSKALKPASTSGNSEFSNIEFDQGYFENKVEQYKQVFPDYELVGWFTIGEDIDDFDRKMFHNVGKILGKTGEKFSDNPLVMKLNPSKICSKTLPVKVYESYIGGCSTPTTAAQAPEVCFTEVQVSLETEDGEKIALDHVAENQTYSGNSGASSVADRFRIQSRAVRMLCDRVKTIVDFVDDAEKNGVDIDPEIMKQISFIANRLPMCWPEGEFENDLNVHFNDNALLVYLGALTKCSATINRYVSRLNSFMPDRVLRRRPGF